MAANDRYWQLFYRRWPGFVHGARKQPMNARIMYIILSGYSITPRDAYQMGCMRLSARIYELRQMFGCSTIKTEIVERRGKRYASYSLEAK